ncbi:MAG: hypothetical protein A7315_03715 [Candidatus Altiarchaeales archaeon WOR_SM1_79]|nr:MAG: hypothetical protein A7315_03715 [Candidatus Altiarchaeales archaeon WOR_SM1_79]
MCIIISAIFFFDLMIIFPPFTQGDGYGDYPPATDGDWIIENDTYVSEEVIVIEGNIEVKNNATLTLENVTLMINSTTKNIHGIYVDGNSTLNVYNSDITNLSGPYIFFVDGNMTLESSTVSNMMFGIDIEYGDVYIANCSIFSNNQYNQYGVRINGSPILFNNYIHSLHRGIVINYGGAPILINNTITLNNYGVVSVAFGFATLIGNNISNNELGGISIELGYFWFQNNTIFSNGGFGINGDHASINATGNLIYDNERWGIFSWGAPIFHKNNTFQKNGLQNDQGNILLQWDVLFRVFDHNNEELKDVNLTIYDSHGNVMWSGETIGNIRALQLREYEILGDGTELVHTPFTVKVRKGTFTNSTTADIRNNMEVRIVLNTEKKEYKFPFWGLMVVLGVWLIVLVMVIIGAIVTIKNRK